MAMTPKRVLASPESLRGITADDIPLFGNADVVWRVLGLEHGDSLDALATRLRALALVALDAAYGVEHARPDDLDWWRLLGGDLVRRTGDSLGVLHARRAAGARAEFRGRARMLRELDRVTREVESLKSTLIDLGLAGQRTGRDAMPGTFAAAAKHLKDLDASGVAGTVPDSWRRCVESLDLFSDFWGSPSAFARRVVGGDEGLSLGQLSALVRWGKALAARKIDAAEPSQLWVRDELRGPPRGTLGRPRPPKAE